MTVNFQHLRAFHAVALDQNVSRAARRLNISQSTLSKQVKALEDRYQVKLIEGSRPPLTLTQAGLEVFDLARKLFGISDTIAERLGDATTHGKSAIRLGTDSPPHAANFMAACLAQAPLTDFKVSVGNARTTNELLLSAQIDLAIVCEPVVHPDYSYIPLYQDRLVAVVPVGWARAELDPSAPRFNLRWLARETLLVREPNSRTLTAIQAMLTEAGIAPLRTMEMHTREMIREAVARGIGISLMMRAECPPDARLQTLEIGAGSRHLGVTGYLAFQSERRNIAYVRDAVAIAKAIAESEAADL